MNYFRDNVEKAEGYQPGFQPAETNVVKLNTNENPYPPSLAVMDAIRNISQEQMRRYPDPQGNKFRKAASEVFGVPSDYIICCNGGDELLKMAFCAFCDENRPVAYPVPTYSLYPVLANLQNCRAIEVPFDGEFSLPAENLVAASAALTIVCNPNAPSGTFTPKQKLSQLAKKLKGVLLIDEAYVDFAEDNCLELVKNFDNVIILRSMSKGYSLAGLRFGFGIANENLIKGLMKVKDSYNVDAIAIAAATAAIQDQDYFGQNVKKVKAERARLTQQLRNLGFDVSDSSANFVLAKSKSPKAAEIYKKLVERKIYVRYFDYPGINDKLRITVGTSEQNDKLLSAMKKILAK